MLPAVLPLLTACAGVLGPGTLDAHFEPSEGTSHAGVGESTERAQSFTVENDGTLAQIDLWVTVSDDASPLQLQVVRLDDAGAPSVDPADVVLDMTAKPAGLLRNESVWFEIPVEKNAPVTAGEQLAWTASAPDDVWGYGLLGAELDEDGEAYKGGGNCDRAVGNYEWKSCDGGADDFGFRIWVDTGD